MTCRRSAVARTSSQRCRQTSWRRPGRTTARSDEETIVEQRVVAVQGAAESAYDSPLGRQRLLETEPPRQERHRTEAGQYAEDAAPAHDSAELAAEYRSDHRRQTRDQEQP